MTDQEKAEAFALPPIQVPPTSEIIMNGGVEDHEIFDRTEIYDTISQRRTIILISSVTTATAVLGFLNGFSHG